VRPHHGGGYLTTLNAAVSGAVFQLDAYSVDAASNDYRSSDDSLRIWKDLGTGSPADLTTASIYERPHLKMDDDSGEDSVAFDGVDDRLTFPTSNSRFAFIHQTGIFDLYLGFRQRGCGVRALFGCMTNTSTAKGLSVVVTADGLLSIALGNGAAAICLAASFELEVPKFTPTMLLVRGDGANIKVSQDLYDFETAAFTGALGAGNAAANYTIGASSGTQDAATNTTFQGDLFWASLYSTNLNASDLATMRACLRSRVGDQA
jgi:hypothetical protein